MAVNEHILREAIRKIILESIRSEKTLFKSRFIKQHPEYEKKAPTPTGGGEPEARLGNKDPTFVVTDTVARKLISAIKSDPNDPDDLGYEVVKVITPGLTGHKSNKYNTYIIQPVGKEGSQIPVVFGRSTAGQRFEYTLHKQLGDQLLSDTVESDLASGFLEALGLKATDIKSIDELGDPAKRPLTDKIKDVGEVISDITLHTEKNERTDKLPGKDNDGGRVLYISLKDPKGDTYANQGYASAFTENESGVFYIGAHISDAFINALGIDKDKVVAGLSDYVSGNISGDDLCVVKPVEFKADIIKQYLGAAMGFGYTYARKRHGGWYVMALHNATDVESAIGTPTEVRITYARNCESGRHPKSKGTRATIKTSNGAKYDVALRNTKGGIRPTGIIIKILKYPDNKISENIDRAFIRRLILEEVNEYAPAKESPRNIALRLLEEHGLELAMNMSARDGNLAVLKILMDFGPHSASDVRHFPFGRM